MSNSKRERDPLRTGIFGLVLVICIVLIAFGYAGLPFWPQGRSYDAYFADAAGISPGNSVYVSGIKVGKVSAVSLAGDSARITFTVDRHVAVGDQSGRDPHRHHPGRAVRVGEPGGYRQGDQHPTEPDDHPYTSPARSRISARTRTI